MNGSMSCVAGAGFRAKDEISDDARSTSADNTLRDLHYSLYPTKAEFINCFIIHSE